MLTVTAIKADVGSIGGHTKPSSHMMALSRDLMARAAEEGIIIDFDVTHTGDDICLLMVHKAWNRLQIRCSNPMSAWWSC